MVGNPASYGGESPDPSDHTGQVPSGAVGANGEVDNDVVAVLADGLRVIRGDRQWILQTRGAKTWINMAFCATREGLLLRLKDHLLREHLLKIGHYQVRRVKAPDAKDRLIDKSTVSREALDATDAARAALRRGDVSGFAIAPEAWGVIEALPASFPRHKR